MQPSPDNLCEVIGMMPPLIGFYDVPDKKPFEPFATPKNCVFSCYEQWIKGESTCISEENCGSIGCPGAGYWLCGVESVPRTDVAYFLAGQEGLKASPELMCQWLEHQPPYKKEHAYVVIAPLHKEQYEYLKTVTFYVNPDQLSLLLTGAEYHYATGDSQPVETLWGAGCGQLAAFFGNLDVPRAMIGATDIAMRPYLPPHTLAVTVTKPMFQQLCELDKNSFLYKSYWQRLVKARGEK
jgi:hypothetical protein